MKLPVTRRAGRILLTGFLVVQLMLGYVGQAALVHAQIIPDPINTNTSGTTGSVPQYTGRGVEQSLKDYLCVPDDSNLGTALFTCITKLYRFGIAFGAIALVFFVVFAGYTYIAGGEGAKGKAKGIILSAITGMAIMLSSYVLLNFINPDLVKIKPIQPPIFTASGLPKCEDVGLGVNCVLPSGQVNYPGGTGVPGSSSEAQYKALITKYAQLRNIEYCALSALMQKESSFNYLAVSNGPPSNVNTSASPPTYGLNFESVGHGIGLIQIYIYERRRGASTGWVNGVPARAGAGFGFTTPLYVKDLIDPDTNVKAGSFLWAKNIKDNNNNLYEAYRDYQGPSSAPATLQKLVDMYAACKARGGS
jgi:hypothetical protein